MGDCDLVTFTDLLDTGKELIDTYLTECFVGNTEDDEYIGRRTKSGSLNISLYRSELTDKRVRDEMWARLTMGLPRR